MVDYNYSNFESRNILDGIRLLDKIVIFVAFFFIFIPLIIGIVLQNSNNENIQKEQDMKQINMALGFFYSNSSNIPSERKYPISLCSGQPNEVDYEYTLRNYLTGRRTEVETSAYILESDFPNDKMGVFSQKNNERQIKLRACEQVFDLESKNDFVYNNGSKSCNFDFRNTDKKFRNCYLYASNSEGSSYQLSYYDQKEDKFVIFTKNRQETIKETRVLR